MWVLELPLIAVALVFTGYLTVVAAAAMWARPVRRGGGAPRRHHFFIGAYGVRVLERVDPTRRSNGQKAA